MNAAFVHKWLISAGFTLGRTLSLGDISALVSHTLGSWGLKLLFRLAKQTGQVPFGCNQVRLLLSQEGIEHSLFCLFELINSLLELVVLVLLLGEKTVLQFCEGVLGGELGHSPVNLHQVAFTT